MILTLEITGLNAEKVGAARRKVFKAVGGSIGRAPGNYWALPDPTLHISSQHALIRYVDGVFYIEDTSRNGVCVNSQDNGLVKGQPYALKSGDRIFIEPYEICVSITSPPAEKAASSDNSFGPFASDRSARLPDVVPVSIHDNESDWWEGLGLESKPSKSDSPRLDDLRGKPALNDHIELPRPIDPASEQPSAAKVSPVIPINYNPALDESGDIPVPPAPKPIGDSRVPGPRRRSAVAKPPEPSPVAPPSPKPESNVTAPVPSAGDLHAVLLGAGLENVDVTPELARSFGEILRAVVGGVMDALKARNELKREFRMEMTVYGQKGNNPLKYSVNVDDALHNLLVKRNTAFIGPVEAFEDAFDDVRNHEMAMLAGMRAGFEAMLSEFDPDRLQADFDRQLKKGALLAAPAKLRYWELYREKFHDMVKDSGKCYRELFGDEFVEAYKEQVKRLKG